MPEGHTTPQPPQLSRSVCVSRHVPPQLFNPAPHVVRHVPALHTVPAAHAMPHAPQSRLSVWRSRQTPLQLVSIAPHVV